MRLTKEQELVLEFSKCGYADKEKIGALITDKLDWCYVLGHLAYNRLMGIAYKTIIGCETPRWKVNREFLLSLYMNYEAQKIRTEVQNEIVRELSRELEQSQIEYAFLKGTVISSMLYSVGERASSDIDILINANDITELGNVLKKLGYVQGWYNTGKEAIEEASRENIVMNRLMYGEIVPYVKKVNKPGYNAVKIDVNFSLDWRTKDIEEVVKEFLNSTELYTSNLAGNIRSLKEEYLFLHLLSHFYKESYLYEVVEKQRDLCLYKLVDIYLFIKQRSDKMNWELIKDIIEKYGLENTVYYSLNILLEIYADLKNNSYLTSFMAEMIIDDEFSKEVYSAKSGKKYYWKRNARERFFDMYRDVELEEKMASKDI